MVVVVFLRRYRARFHFSLVSISETSHSEAVPEE